MTLLVCQKMNRCVRLALTFHLEFVVVVVVV